MASTTGNGTSSAPSSSRILPWLVLLFIGSGCAALIYEIVWFQLLSLVVGSSAISLAVLLSTFMGGMCIGSLGLSKFISTKEHPLRVYAYLELGIAAFGLVILWGLPLMDGIYTALGGQGIVGFIVRGMFAGLFLLPPTILMGATLPAIARWVEATPKGVSWLGFFYGGNTAGAVMGCLLAGFVLLRVWDAAIATYTAVVINIAVALVGFAIARATEYERAEAPEPTEPITLTPGAKLVLVTICLSGLTALGAEVIWARLLTLNLGGTVYTFSLILAAFLTGIGLGSGLGSVIAGAVRRPRLWLGACQLLVIAGLGWASYMLTKSMPYWPVDPSITENAWFNFQLDLMRSLVTVLPCAFLWGASFPLALAAIADRGQDPGRLVGTVYAANTLGAIIGALLSSLIVISALKTQGGQRLMMVIAGISAGLMLVPVIVEGTKRIQFNGRSLAAAGGTAVLVLVMVMNVIPVPPLLIAYGRYSAVRENNHGEFIFWDEGMNSSMAVSRLSNGVLNYHNAGKVQASSEPQDMRLQRMLGHMTTLLPENARDVMVIGCGAGVTAGAVSIDPAVTNLTIVEIEPLVPRFVAENFGEHNFDVVRNPKTTVHIDDARHWLLTTDQTFDAITSDPFDPWVKGAATLYTKEFWEVAKSKLNPGGVITVFVQLYESNLAAVKSEVATFLEVFPEGMVFANLAYGQGYDVVMVGQEGPLTIDLDAIDEKLSRPEYALMAESLMEIGFYSASELFSTFAVKRPEVDPWFEDAQINRDRNLRLQYLAGMGVNLYQADAIYRDMAQYRSWPEGLFRGSPERIEAVRRAWDSNG